MPARTKTQRRIETIQRGSKAGSSLGEKALGKAAIDEIRKMTGAHRDTGANTGEEIQRREEIKASMASHDYVAPDDSSAEEIRPPLRYDPRLYVPLAFLLDDLRRRVKLHTRGFSKDERSDIATDAALILMRWTKQGSKAPIYLGQPGELPLRQAWFDVEKRVTIKDGASSRPAPNDRAEKAMRAAILQAARDRVGDSESALANAQRATISQAARASVSDPDSKTELADRIAELAEVSTDADSTGESLAQASLRAEQAKADQAPRLPDSDSADLLADAMGISLSAARTLIARNWRLSTAQQAELFDVSTSRAENIMSAGSKELLSRYPDAGELLDAIDAAGPAIRERLATRAYQRIAALASRRYWEDLPKLLAAAELAVNEWRASMTELPMEQRAIELAAMRIGWSERIGASAYVLRLLEAETVALRDGIRRGFKLDWRGREQRPYALGIRRAASSHLPGKLASPSTEPLARFQRIDTTPSVAPIDEFQATTWLRHGTGYSGASAIPAKKRTIG